LDPALTMTFFWKGYTFVFSTIQYRNIVGLLNAEPRPHGQICDGFFTNWYFGTIFVIMVVMQAPLVGFSGSALPMTLLTWQRPLVCVIFGMGAFTHGLLVRKEKAEVSGATVEFT
jgi:hypothetical protein